MSDKLSDERLREYAASFNNPDVRALAAELLALRAQQQAAGWRVKPLRWNKLSGSSQSDAPSGFGPVYIVYSNGPDRWTWGVPGWPVGSEDGQHKTEAEAKAAAQSDYAARINSAIEPSAVADGYVMVPDATHASNARGPVNCNIVLRHQSKAMPRTCQRCGLGPCPFYRNDGRPISASGRDGE